MTESIHKTVLLNETINALELHDGAVVVDATFGGGGHSAEICRRYRDIKIFALDLDADALSRAKNKFRGLECKVDFINSNFRNLKEVVKDEVDAVLFDLGFSSDQLENSGRGFSFLKDEPLIMTLKSDPSEEDLTAEEVVNTWEEGNLADILYGFGEERYSRRIAKAIVEARREKPLQTTQDLVRVIEGAVPRSYQRKRIHFATKTFQALRIAVNDELGALQSGLRDGFDLLKPGGRLAVIAFHSLEDRIVKKFFSAKGGSAAGGKDNRVAELINKKPITATSEEIKNNPRSRSAKLRVLKKL